jgi:hypothetical protein
LHGKLVCLHLFLFLSLNAQSNNSHDNNIYEFKDNWQYYEEVITPDSIEYIKFSSLDELANINTSKKYHITKNQTSPLGRKKSGAIYRPDRLFYASLSQQ